MNDGRSSRTKKIPYERWLVAFLVPFFVIGGLSVWHWYDYGLKDIHMARARFAGWEITQPSDEMDSLKFALMMGTACGIAAGAFGLGTYGIVVKKRS